jgi:hypothetical protein
MFSRVSPLWWVMALLASACAAPSGIPLPEVEDSTEELVAKCTDSSQCPVTRIACRVCPDGTKSCPEAECVQGRCVQHFPSCETTKIFCGGIAGIPCPGNSVCVDDPDDDCSPPTGADCGGMCVCPKAAICPKGSHWSGDPEVCACVPDATCN